jgi:ribosomal protein L24
MNVYMKTPAPRPIEPRPLEVADFRPPVQASEGNGSFVASNFGAIQRSKATRSGQAPNARDVVQRMAVPLEDVQTLANKGNFTDEQAESARIIKTAVEDRVAATGERYARVTNVREGTYEGGLAKIGLTEELRLFGHGATTQLNGGAAIRVGGYSPQLLAQLLIQMGLPAQYQGEIYLSGCLTAVGDNYGFLGNFYNLIAQHCPGVVVRGNLGNATTFPDGTQGVWSGVHTKEEYNNQIALFTAEGVELMKQAEKLQAKQKSGEITSEVYQVEFNKVKVLLNSLRASKAQYIRVIYDTTGAFTVCLPSKDIRASNAINAIVLGAVTSADDVNALLDRIDEGNLASAMNRLDQLMLPLQQDIENLVARAQALDTQPLTFTKKR